MWTDRSMTRDVVLSFLNEDPREVSSRSRALDSPPPYPLPRRSTTRAADGVSAGGGGNSSNGGRQVPGGAVRCAAENHSDGSRSEEHTAELQSRLQLLYR